MKVMPISALPSATATRFRCTRLPSTAFLLTCRHAELFEQGREHDAAGAARLRSV